MINMHNRLLKMEINMNIYPLIFLLLAGTANAQMGLYGEITGYNAAVRATNDMNNANMMRDSQQSSNDELRRLNSELNEIKNTQRNITIEEAAKTKKRNDITLALQQYEVRKRRQLQAKESKQ